MSTYNTQLQSIGADLQEVITLLQNKATGEQAAPEISVNSNGLITATAGTKSATHQLTTQAAKTVTPSTSEQTVVAANAYTTGAIKVAAVPTQTKSITPTSTIQNITPDSGKFLSKVTVAAVPTQTKTITPTSTTQNITPDSGKFLSKVTVTGDSNLVASNIKSGVSIFGVNGTLEEEADLPSLSNPATASEIFLNKETINANGNKITGTFTIDNELTVVEELLTELETALENKGTYNTIYIGTSEPTNDFGLDGDLYIVRSDSL